MSKKDLMKTAKSVSSAFFTPQNQEEQPKVRGGKSTDKKHIAVYLASDEAEELKLLAQLLKTTVSELCGNLILEELKKEEYQAKIKQYQELLNS